MFFDLFFTSVAVLHGNTTTKLGPTLSSTLHPQFTNFLGSQTLRSFFEVVHVLLKYTRTTYR